MKKAFIFLTALFTQSLLFGQDFVESINSTAFRYFDLLKQSNTNIIFSPTSINSAMALTYIGSKSNTFTEISNSLNFNPKIDSFNQNYQVFSETNFFDNKSISIFNANSLWLQEGLKLDKAYIFNTEKFYNSSIFNIDFSDNVNSQKTINKWVYQKTNGNITDLLKPSDIDNSTRLVLVNAIYFKGVWNKQFKKDLNTKENFEYKRKRYIETTYMNNSINSWYYEDNNFYITEIPYLNKTVSLMIIMPKSLKKRKLRKAYQNINIDLLNSYIANKELKKINVSLPKFEIESDFNLNNILKQIGIVDAFNSNANFSGITNQEKLFINKVVHKAKITVNEEGTEASAATAVIMRKTAINVETIDFKINKPFIYILKNNSSNLIYFMGQVNNPNY